MTAPTALASGADPRLDALSDRVRSLAHARGREDVARALDWRLGALSAGDPLTVVIAGRTNSGKSTLVNALLGRPVVEAGSHRTTTAAAVVRYGTDAEALRNGELYEISVDDPLLAGGLCLVDTPGMDSGDEPERARAVRQVLGADILVFVLDPLAPLSRPEARFLEEATRALADVVFVMGKADVTQAPDAMIAADRAVLSRIAPRWAQAPVFAVSALEKLHADATGDDGLAEASGVPALARHLSDQFIANVAVVRSAGLVQACRAALHELELADRAALAGDDRGAALAKAAIADHRAYVEATTPEWTADFGREYQRRARQVIERDLRLRLLERREQNDIRIKSGAVALEEVTVQVKADLEAVAEQMQHALVENVSALMSEWVSRLELTAVHLPALTALEAGEVLLPGAEIGSTTWDARERAQGLAGLVNLARSAAAGRSFAGLLPGGLAMGTGVGIVLTGLSWGASEWLRHKVQDQQGALSFVQAAFTRAQIDLESGLRDHALELQPVAQSSLQARIEDRRQELALLAARLQEEADEEALDGERARTVVAERLRELEAFADGLDALGTRFTDFLRTGDLPDVNNPTTHP